MIRRRNDRVLVLEYYGSESEFAPRSFGRYEVKTDIFLQMEHLLLDGRELFCADRIEVFADEGMATGRYEWSDEMLVYDLATEQVAF